MSASSGFPCLAEGEVKVDGALMPVACDLEHGHDRSHYDLDLIVFWGREHDGREYPTEPPTPTRTED